jgi:hypothetical protein
LLKMSDEFSCNGRNLAKWSMYIMDSTSRWSYSTRQRKGDAR